MASNHYHYNNECDMFSYVVQPAETIPLADYSSVSSFTVGKAVGGAFSS